LAGRDRKAQVGIRVGIAAWVGQGRHDEHRLRRL
jgi:hypothetical protein